MPTVETLLIDAHTHNIIARAQMPVESLPQSFAASTKIHIAGEDWEVIKADPMTAEECIQTGKLVLTLGKLFKTSPTNINFSLPTICDEIPEILAGSTKQRKKVFELHEDDWRQIEFISQSYQSAIDSQWAGIMHIYREASVGSGSSLAFRACLLGRNMPIKVRKGVLKPLRKR